MFFFFFLLFLTFFLTFFNFFFLGETSYVVKIAAYNAFGVAPWSPSSMGTLTTAAQPPSRAEEPPQLSLITATTPDQYLATWE